VKMMWKYHVENIFERENKMHQQNFLKISIRALLLYAYKKSLLWKVQAAKF
jgi:hypothetical protein